MSASRFSTAGLDRPAKHVYRGVWGVLTGIFKVPQEPPDLPVTPGEFHLAVRPALGFLNYLRMQFLVGLIFAGVLILIGFGSISFTNFLAGVIGIPLALGVELLSAMIGLLAIHLRYDTTWYVLNSRSLRLRRGIWVIQETTITFENIQNVRVTQGPIQRLFGIATILVETAGGKPSTDGQSSGHAGQIEGISNAAELRDLILNQAAQRRSGLSDSGLGDEADAGNSKPARSASTWNREQVELLSEVRDLIHSL